MTSRNLLACVFATVFALSTSAATLYVDLNSPNPAPPYNTWATAAHVIQDAISAAATGDTVLVTNGLYNTGIINHMFGPDRVLITNAVTVRSVNGPAVTIIQGDPANNVRCAFVDLYATLSGFTLTGGGTASSGHTGNGGGACCPGTLATVSNCWIQGNSAGVYGGGTYGGTVVNCLLMSNTVISMGGGSAGSKLKNCLIVGNSAAIGGGVQSGSLYNCTVADNSASSSAGGTYTCGLNNCIVYYNEAPSYPNYLEGLAAPSTFYSCTTPGAYTGGNNFTNEPLFINRPAGDYRLQPNSPCINAGNNAFMTNDFDLDMNPRTSRGTVDVGAYEFPNPASWLSYVWAQNYGFPTDGTADFLDPDHDGATHYQECFSGTVPTNAASVLKLASPVPDATGVSLTWSCVYGKKYYIERSTNFNAQPAFITISSGNPGSFSGTMTLRDNQATNAGPYFYRIGVHQDR